MHAHARALAFNAQTFTPLNTPGKPTNAATPTAPSIPTNPNNSKTPTNTAAYGRKAKRSGT